MTRTHETASDSTSRVAVSQSWWFSALYLCGITLFGASLLIGIFFRLRVHGGIPSVYDVYLRDGDRSMERGDYTRASNIYRVASSINREDKLLLKKLVKALEMSNQAEEAGRVRTKLEKLEKNTRSDS